MTWFTKTKYCNTYLLKEEKEKKVSRVSFHFQNFLLVFNLMGGLIANILLGLNFMVLPNSTKSSQFNASKI